VFLLCEGTSEELNNKEKGMRSKHRKDYNHGKNGWVVGNPRYGKAVGSTKGSRAKIKVITFKLAEFGRN